MLQSGRRSYQKLSDQAAPPPDRTRGWSREEQRSRRRKREQKQTVFQGEKCEIKDRNPAESPPQRESLRHDKAKPEGQGVETLESRNKIVVSKDTSALSLRNRAAATDDNSNRGFYPLGNSY